MNSTTPTTIPIIAAGDSPFPRPPPLRLLPPPELALLETDPPGDTPVDVGCGVGLDVAEEAESDPTPNPPGDTPVDEGLRVVDDVDVDSDGESNGPAKPPGFGAGPAPGLVRDGGSMSGPLSPPDLNLGDRASRTAILVRSSKTQKKRYALDQSGGASIARAGAHLK